MSALPDEGVARAVDVTIDKKSGCRLPLPSRDDLGDAGQAAWDRANRPGTLAGLQGPAGVQLHIPHIAPHLSALNIYLRHDAGFAPRVREVAILATAREMDSQFEWATHEQEAARVGVPTDVIEAIRHGRSLDGLPDEDTLIIDLARQLWRTHRVRPETYARVHAQFGTRQMLELVVLMGTYANTAAMLALVDMQVPPDFPGRMPDLERSLS